MANALNEIDVAALDGLIQRLKDAQDYDLTLSADDIQLLLSALATLSTLQSHLSDKDVTIHTLRKLVGMVSRSEKMRSLLKTATSASNTDSPSNRAAKRKKKARTTPTVSPAVAHHALEEVKKGQRCPDCQTGTLSKYEPTVLLRITGHSPYTAVKHIAERCRCNACGHYYTAALPAAVLTDGSAQQKYGYSARALMALSKYYLGAPFYRQESLQTVLGMPISASTVFDQCEYLANDILPIYRCLQALAANAVHFHLDDTPHRILNHTEQIKPQRQTQKRQKRTGTYASGLIATLADGQAILLIQTDIGHAGEWIDAVLAQREAAHPPPIVMSDALPHNRPLAVPVQHVLCNAHGRRQFVDVLHPFPDDVAWVLNEYKKIWHHEDDTLEQSLSPDARLAYHRQHSLPVMATLRDWGQQQLTSQRVEANSGLGKAIQYFLNHYEGLTGFCRIAGAKLDNNEMESQLRLIVLNRKNAHFYKTLAGAAISDVITSVIATCARNQVNPFEYLIAIQQNRDQVKATPTAWLPWCYSEQLADAA